MLQIRRQTSARIPLSPSLIVPLCRKRIDTAAVVLMIERVFFRERKLLVRAAVFAKIGRDKLQPVALANALQRAAKLRVRFFGAH